MTIEINEEDVQKWATEQIKARVKNEINREMNEWNWRDSIRNEVEEVVQKKVTDMAVNGFIKELDRDYVINAISQRVALEITHSFNLS